MLKKTSDKGFTIIEVVITIAIGAAVMALVLNAVAGARRSQRNNARISDVATVTGAVNDYIANRNTLPTTADDIDDAIDDLNQYLGGNELPLTFAANIWDTSKPANNGEFLIWQPLGGAVLPNGTSLATPDGSVAGYCSNPLLTTLVACVSPASWTATSPGSGTWKDEDDQDRHDFLVIVRSARCNGDNTGIQDGGLRRIVIVYKLEGQDGITCRDI